MTSIFTRTPIARYAASAHMPPPAPDRVPTPPPTHPTPEPEPPPPEVIEPTLPGEDVPIVEPGRPRPIRKAGPFGAQNQPQGSAITTQSCA